MPANNPDLQLVDISLPLPVFSSYSYLVPENLADRALTGVRALVPFGKRRITGFLIGSSGEKPKQRLKEIIDILDSEPLFSEKDLQFYKWISTYYMHPLGQTIQTALPPGLNAEFDNFLKITPSGARQLEKFRDEYGYPVLKELALSRQCSSTALKKKTGIKSMNHVINTLKDRGLIEMDFKKSRPGTGIRMEKHYSVSSNTKTQSLTLKQQQIFSFVEKKGSVSTTVIKETLGNCKMQLDALCRKGLIICRERELPRSFIIEKGTFNEPVNELTGEQKETVKIIKEAVEEQNYKPFLLYGVTGSGKTEVYIRAMEETLKRGRQCLFLLPEIALTNQLYERITSRLSAAATMIHSSIGAAQKYDAWRKIKKGDIKVVIGARSAVFAPFNNLGIIVVDEEHDPGYKQDSGLRYNARDISIVKARVFGAVVILGSATPSVESYYNALNGKYNLTILNHRIKKRDMPRVTILDMKIESSLNKDKGAIISPKLAHEISTRLELKQQTLLFLNRRGFSPSYFCRNCGYVFKCQNCDVSFIYYRQKQRLCCHYCSMSRAVPEKCPECEEYFLGPMGWGTERLESEIKRCFPSAKIARLDSDTSKKKGAAGKIINDVYHRNIDILIGTQMIVKGYHLPWVTLVGIVCADHSLNFPDYRAGERAFQLLTQAAGRAGREELDADVYVQTYSPNHYSVLCAGNHDYKAFYNNEITFRKSGGYPPFKRIVNIRFESNDREKAEKHADKTGTIARKISSMPRFKDVIEILGPAPSPWEKIRSKYRFQMFVKSISAKTLRDFVSDIFRHESLSRKEGINTVIDVDPVFIL